MISIEKIKKRIEVEEDFEYMKWVNEIPALNFKKEWSVKIVPPFSGAVVRFQVETEKDFLSIYLDCYNELGFMNAPYWEIYSRVTEDTYRFNINDTKGLLRKIEQLL